MTFLVHFGLIGVLGTKGLNWVAHRSVF